MPSLEMRLPQSVILIVLVLQFVINVINLVLYLKQQISSKPSVVDTYYYANTTKNELSIREMSFGEGFSNVFGADRFIVPNIIHFIRFNQTEYSLIDYVVIKAAMRNQRPDYFYIHTDVPGPGNFTGRYWNLIKEDYELWSRIRLLHLNAPTEIFGQQIKPKLRFYHGGDISRIRILQEHGGIYLDNDVYVVQNLDKYRRFECTINWKRQASSFGTQVIIAHKNARFLALYLELYRNYDDSSWYYNAGEKPVQEILIPHPELIHRVEGRFDSDPTTAGKIYEVRRYNWRRLDTIHLFSNWFSGVGLNKTIKVKDFTEAQMRTYRYPFGEMVREVV